jgi:hypothetical protein
MDVLEMIAAREITHGDFRDVARIAQRFKAIAQAEYKDKHGAVHREGMEMILHKIARMLAGDPDFDDHWKDVGGYAERVRTLLGKSID